MKIRTQLVLAFLLLAIVPLTAIVLFSYVTSLSAVRSAVAEESLALAGEMDDRLSSVRRDLVTSFAPLGEFPFQSLSAGELEEGGAPGPLIDELVLAMGDSARLVQSLEFVPAAEGAEGDRVPSADRIAGGEGVGAGPGFPAAGDFPAAGAPPVPPAPSAPKSAGGVVIDVPRVLAEIRTAKAALARSGESGEAEGSGGGAAVGLAVEVLGEIAADLAAETAALEEEMHRIEAEGDEVDPMARHRLEAVLEAQREARHEIKLKLKDAIEARRRLTEEQRAAIEARRREQRLVFGQEFQVPVEEEGQVVGHVTACVAGRDLLADVLKRTTREEGEVPFAIDREGNLYTVDEEDKAVVEGLDLRPMAEAPDGGEGRWYPAAGEDEWVLATSEDEVSGLTFGIARPIRQSLAEVRTTAARNFGFGLALIAVGLLGIQPLSRRMTRHLDAVTHGADRIARGDLTTRVPVSSTSELGRLAGAFNRMAEDLSRHQEREVRQRVLEAEYARKSDELEEARRFQLSLLPRRLPEHPDLELAVAMTTATEVGGDFYDFLAPAEEALAPEGTLTTVVGDATGHGARAGTMVTVVKSLLIADAGASGPAEFLRSANRAIRRMRLERMAMALLVARYDRTRQAGDGGDRRGGGGRLTVASAGMPPALVHRSGSGEVEELELSGMPLGGLDDRFRQLEVELRPGDTVLLMSDGFPELPNRSGDPLGYAAARRCFAEVAGRPPQQVIETLQAMARRWAGGEDAPADDMTFVVLRVR